MSGLLWFFSYAFASLAWFVLVVWLCLFLYRSLRLPALPWIACRYALAFVAWIFTGYAFRRIFPAGTSAIRPMRVEEWSLPPGAWIALTETLIEAVVDLLVAVLAFSEVAFLVSRAFPDIHSRLLTFLLAARGRVRTIGLTACLLTASVPIAALLFLWLHGPFPTKA